MHFCTRVVDLKAAVISEFILRVSKDKAKITRLGLKEVGVSRLTGRKSHPLRNVLEALL